MLDSSYSTKEWVERRKRKQLVKRELHLIDPDMGLFNANNELLLENWREFKRSRCITSATMNVLLERPGEAFFAERKQLKSKNKTAAQISPRAAEFFKVFLEKRNNFAKPTGVAYLRPYKISENQHTSWPKSGWLSNTATEIKLGVIDFRTIPGALERENSTVEKPFFYEVLTSIQKIGQPRLEHIKSWLFICGDEVDQTQVLAYVERNEILKTFKRTCSDYYPARNELMMDLPAHNAKALKKILLIFLQDPSNAVQVRIYPEFRAPDTPVYTEPRRYNELPFRMYNPSWEWSSTCGWSRSSAMPGQVYFPSSPEESLLAQPWYVSFSNSGRYNLKFH